MSIGSTIKKCRELRGLTQTKLAERSEISVSHLCLVEKGKRDLSLSSFESVSDALGVPASVMLFLAAKGREITELSEDEVDNLSKVLLELVDVSSRQKSLL